MIKKPIDDWTPEENGPTLTDPNADPEELTPVENEPSPEPEEGTESVGPSDVTNSPN